MNLNELAKEVTKRECGKEEISIAQVKEVIKVINSLIYQYPEVLASMIKSGKKTAMGKK